MAASNRVLIAFNIDAEFPVKQSLTSSSGLLLARLAMMFDNLVTFTEVPVVKVSISSSDSITLRMMDIAQDAIPPSALCIILERTVNMRGWIESITR